MNRLLLLLTVASFFALTGSAQTAKQSKFVDAAKLTMIGKAFPTAPFYHRVDTSLIKGMTTAENRQARASAGLALLFSTNSTYIDLAPRFRWKNSSNAMPGMSSGGFDLYIKKANSWLYAGTAALPDKDSVVSIVWDMDNSQKECMLHLPMYSEIDELKIGVQLQANISATPDPFKNKVAIFGSSFTQGVSSSRPGMSFPMQIGRALNINLCNLGFSGNSKLQPYFAEMLANLKVDALIFDAFSNPTDTLIRERLESFVATIAAKQKDIPLIFLHTLYRGRNNFNQKSRASEESKRKVAAEIMKELMRKYPNVYLIDNPITEEVNGDMSADSVHPSDLGYHYLAKNIAPQIALILRKYNIAVN